MLDQYKATMSELFHKAPMLGQVMCHHRNTRGQPMSFQNFPSLPSLYKELPRGEGADIRKGVQTGLSELMICLCLYHAGWQGRIVSYVLPTFGARDRFVAQRINRILLQSHGYRALLPNGKDTGNNKLKRFGSGSMLFLGSNTQVDFVEFSADTLIVDELDQCDPANLTKARDRLRASSDPKMYRLGNPTLPSVGICKLFDEGDQRHWTTTCPHCGEWQCIDWFENIVRKDVDTGDWLPRDPNVQIKGHEWKTMNAEIQPVCRRCNKAFARHRYGEWVAQFPSRERQSYTMSRIDVISDSLTALYKEWMLAQGDLNRLSTFYTSVLGQGFEHSGARLSAEHLHEIATGDELDYGGGKEYEDMVVSMGVDVGSVLNLTISVAVEEEAEEGVWVARRQTVFIGAVRHFEEIQDLVLRFHVDCLVIDSMPETRKCQELRDWALNNTACQVWLCRFHPNAKVSHEKYGRKLQWRDRIVTVDRTQILDVTFDEIVNKERTIPSDVFTVLGYVDQMRAPVRVLNQEKGRVIWTEGSSADHYRFADVYDRIAFDLSQLQGTFG